MIELALILAYIFIGVKIADRCKDNMKAPAVMSICILLWPLILVFWLFLWQEVDL